MTRRGRFVASGPRPPPQSAYCAQAAVRLPWVSMAPLGRPVVPPVYCNSMMSSGHTGGSAAGSGAVSQSSIRSASAGIGGEAGGAPMRVVADHQRRDQSLRLQCGGKFSSPSCARVTSTRAPLSRSLWMMVRGASIGESCVTRIPASAAPKTTAGWKAVLPSSSAMPSLAAGKASSTPATRRAIACNAS